LEFRQNRILLVSLRLCKDVKSICFTTASYVNLNKCLWLCNSLDLTSNRTKESIQMNITKKLIRNHPGHLAFFSMIVAVFLLAACGDTTTTVPSSAPGAAAVTASNTSGAMMAQTPGTTLVQTPGAMMGQTPGGMMGNNGSNNSGGTARPLAVSEAKDAVTSYLNQLGNKDLAIDEIMTFDNNAYVAIKDGKTGVGAFELLVNPETKAVFPEYGPNMMWNLKYGYMSGNGTNGMLGQQMNQMMGNGTNGMMGNGVNGMMGSLGLVNNEAVLPGKMPVTADQALQATQTYLDKAYPGVQSGVKADEYPGYYTVDVQTQGKLSGMLSVNGFTGQVWYHTWHGQFIEMADYGK
jgi:hypothetical protein